MDAYSKAVFTVIAIALSALALEHSGVMPARAFEQRNSVNSSLSGVSICGPTQGGRFWDCANVVDGALIVRTQ